MTTAINILATFRLVFNWLSRLRLAEFMVVIPPLLGSFSRFRLTNLMVVLQVLQQKERKKIHQMDMISFFFFPPSHVPRKKGPLSMFPIMVDGLSKNHMVAFYGSLYEREHCLALLYI